MNRTKLFNYALRIILAIGLLMLMFFGSGIALFGMGLLNLVLVILSFDELFVNSPFNQTSMATIEASLAPLAQSAVLMFMIGMLLTIFCVILIFFVLFGEFKKEEKKDE